ncbi:GDSL-type esterase/lipase family protein [Myxococcota bacterium]|nr:GDSL-type esterase/lipase family protein [Myxococcota bacterium]
MRRPRAPRPLGLAVLALAAVPAAWAAGPAALPGARAEARPVDPWIVMLPDGGGPPEQSCADALKEVPRAPDPAPSPARPPPPPGDTSPRPPAEPEALVEVEVGKDAPGAGSLPGATPEDLPPQPLEGPPEALARIGAVLRRASTEPVRLSFFGASHTEGDHWTGQIRRVLQARHGDRGHGFVLPAGPVKGYRATDVNLCYTGQWLGDWGGRAKGHGDGLLGPGGVSVGSEDPGQFGWVETTRTNPQGGAVSAFDVFYLSEPRGGTLLLQVDGLPPKEVPTRSDDVALSRVRLEVPDGPHRLKVSPKGDGPVRVFGISMERNGPGVIVDAIGIRGAKASSWLKWDRDMAARGLATLDPDLVVLAYGTNEAADRRYPMDLYRAELRAVLGDLRRALPDVPCILVGPSDRGVKLRRSRYAIWDRTQPVAQVQREVAPEFGCASWDWQQASGGPGSQIAWLLHDPPLAAPDLIHHTAAGYRAIADRFVAALDAVAAGTAPGSP